jgi:putative ABC transport system permease protein
VAVGVYLSFRVLDYPDLTIDGSLPLGAAVAASMITAGWSPYLTLPAAALAGALAGLATALIATRLRIHSLLASILTTTALFSINLHIMGRSNIPLLNEPTIFTRLTPLVRGLLVAAGGAEAARYTSNLTAILLVGLMVLAIKIMIDGFMRTEIGLGLQAAGNNPQMARAVGIPTDNMALLGLALSNALVGLSGAIFAQYQGFADINMGMGLIIAGLAAVILGETFFRPRSVPAATTAAILGMLIYRLVIAAALNIAVPLPGGGALRIDPLDVKLATALLVLAALWLTRLQKGAKRA